MEQLKDNPFYGIFNRQKANQFKIGNTSYKERLKKLDRLKNALEVDYKQQLREAMYADFKKPFLETDMTEIYPVLSEIKFAKSNLKSCLCYIRCI